jgi:hypothetical protein
MPQVTPLYAFIAVDVWTTALTIAWN